MPSKVNPVKVRCCPFCGSKKVFFGKKKARCFSCGCKVSKEFWNRRFVDKVSLLKDENGEWSKIEYVGEV